MGRAARRAQQRAERRQRRQQAGTAQRPVVTAPGPPIEAEHRGGSFLRPRWAMDIIGELRKVTWPTRQETAHLTVVVIVVSILVGALLGASDLGFSWLLENVFLE